MIALIPSSTNVVCAPTIRAVYVLPASASAGPLVHLVIARDGRFALVGWSRRETGGMSVFERRDANWCQVANGGGAFDESALGGFDGINRGTAHRLFAKLKIANDDAR